MQVGPDVETSEQWGAAGVCYSASK